MTALTGIRVVDFTTGVAGPYCTKLLADFGAEVIKVEPRGGDPARAMPPFAADQPGADRSLQFLYLNTNKRSITVHPDTADGQRLLTALIRTAQVVVEDLPPGALPALGLGYDDMAAEQPTLVYASITPWGQDGPYVDLDLRASELILQGMGGPVNQTGVAEREPIKLGGNLAQMQAGVAAAFAIVAAVYRAEGGGEGDYIDLSIYETQAGTRDRRTTSLTSYAYHGGTSRRQPRGFVLAQGIQPALDGYINIWAVGPRIDAFVTMIGRADLVGDPRLRGQRSLLPPELIDELQAAYTIWSMSRTARDAVAEAQSHGLYAGVVNTPASLVSDPHYRERGVWETIDHPETGPVEYPGRPFLLSDSPRTPARRAPFYGEHNAEILAALGGDPATLPQLRALDVL